MTLQIPHQEVGEVGRVVIVLAAGKLAAQLVPLALLPARRRHCCRRVAATAARAAPPSPTRLFPTTRAAVSQAAAPRKCRGGPPCPASLCCHPAQAMQTGG